MVYIVFVVIWIVSFLPAWYLLLKLVALSTSKVRLLSWRFISIFTLYQLVIVLPYLYLLLFGGNQLNSLVQYLLTSVIVISFLISFLRFFLSDHVNSILWNVYGIVYDGLLYFYPYQHLQELVAAEVKPTKEMHILDLGAGSGNQSVKLAQFGCKIDAVDNSYSMLRKLHKKISKNNITNIDVYHADLIEYIKSVRDDSYDRVVLTNVIYTINDRDTFWREILRITKTNGKIVATNSDRSGSKPLIIEHVKNKNRRSLLRPSLVAVFVIDMLISEMAKSGQYNFISEEIIKSEVESAGGKYNYIKRCYGGDEDGVNILFDITK